MKTERPNPRNGKAVIYSGNKKYRPSLVFTFRHDIGAMSCHRNQILWVPFSRVKIIRDFIILSTNLRDTDWSKTNARISYRVQIEVIQSNTEVGMETLGRRHFCARNEKENRFVKPKLSWQKLKKTRKTKTR